MILKVSLWVWARSDSWFQKLKGGYGAVISREHPVLTCRRFILVVYLNIGDQVAFQGL